MHTKFIDRSPSKTEWHHNFYMVEAMRRFDYDMRTAIATNDRVPQDWHDIASRRDSAKKKTCFSVDEDVVKWFRSMGPAYQPRMNVVLRSCLHAKLMGLTQGDETLDMSRHPIHADRRQPEWGDTQRRREQFSRRAGPEQPARTPDPEAVYAPSRVT